jgi:hypothetical protein
LGFKREFRDRIQWIDPRPHSKQIEIIYQQLSAADMPRYMGSIGHHTRYAADNGGGCRSSEDSCRPFLDRQTRHCHGKPRDTGCRNILWRNLRPWVGDMLRCRCSDCHCRMCSNYSLDDFGHRGRSDLYRMHQSILSNPNHDTLSIHRGLPHNN